MLPQLRKTARIRKTYEGFGGLNFACSCAPNEFSDMLNFCSDGEPCAVTRPKRALWYRRGTDPDGNEVLSQGVIETGAAGITGGVCVCGKIVLCAGSSVYYDGSPVAGVTLTSAEHGIVPFGRSFFIIPENILVTPTGSGVTAASVNAPLMDFAVCRGNRIYGCRFGENADGDHVNEIYVSKQGDAASWFTFDGISTDSYVSSVGAPGQFTGAAVCLDRTLFFKEDCLITVSGDCPAEFSAVCLPCEGAEAGSHRAIVNIGDGVYYKSRAGITVYDGAFPRVISSPLGAGPYENPCAGTAENKYYIAMTGNGVRSTFVYDTQKRLWHREDCAGTELFIRRQNCLFAVNKTAEISSGAAVRKFYTVGITDARFAPAGVNIFTGETGSDYRFAQESTLPWSLTTGRISGSGGRQLRLREIVVALNTAPAGSVSASVSADGGAFLSCGSFTPAAGLTRIRCPVPACDFVRVRLAGTGDCEITSMTLIYEERNKI